MHENVTTQNAHGAPIGIWRGLDPSGAESAERLVLLADGTGVLEFYDGALPDAYATFGWTWGRDRRLTLTWEHELTPAEDGDGVDVWAIGDPPVSALPTLDEDRLHLDLGADLPKAWRRVDADLDAYRRPDLLRPGR